MAQMVVDESGVRAVDEDDRAEVDAKVAAEQRIEDTRLVMRDAAGRRFVYDTILELGGFDPVHGERGAGRHEAALHIIARVKEAGMTYYHTMIRENEK